MGLDRDAVDELYRQAAPVIHRRALRFLKTEAEAWDAVHDVFIKLLNAGVRFEGRSTLVTYAYSATTKHCLNLLRSRSRRDKAYGAVADAPSTPTRAPEDRVDAGEFAQRLASALPERSLEIAIYKYVDEMTAQEIAEVLSVSRRTVTRELERLHSFARESHWLAEFGGDHE